MYILCIYSWSGILFSSSSFIVVKLYNDPVTCNYFLPEQSNNVSARMGNYSQKMSLIIGLCYFFINLFGRKGSRNAATYFI